MSDQRKSSKYTLPSNGNRTRQTSEIDELHSRIAELEGQNQELRATQERLEGLLAKYEDLYEISPVGYLTLNEGGEIMELNETCALLLGVEKGVVIGSTFLQFIGETSRNAFSQYLNRLIETAEKRSVEVQVTGKGSHPFYGLVEGIVSDPTRRPFELSFTLVDITKAKETMDKLQDIYDILMGGGAGTIGASKRVIGSVRHHRHILGGGVRTKLHTASEDADAESSRTPEGQEYGSKEIEERVVININDLIIPHIEGLKKSGLSLEQRKCLSAIEEILKDIVSPFIQKVLSRYVNLTSREVQIAGFIRYGFTTKEIAQTLGISLNAVEIHRASLRKKFNLKHEKANLRSFLLSLPL